MKDAKSYIILIYFSLIIFNSCNQNEYLPLPKGSYLGQEPPGFIPKIFAPEVISTQNVSETCAGFSIDNKMFIFLRFFSNKSDSIFITQLKDDKWIRPYPAPFNSNYSEWDCNFASDGRTFYFSSNRPVDNNDNAQSKFNIWMTQITSTGFSQPTILEYPINTPDYNDCYASTSNDGTIYFHSTRDGGFGQDDIYRAELINGKYISVENLGSYINTEYSECDAFIASDESYIIFCSNRPDTYGLFDLYVSFKKNEKSWSTPVNLGKKINTDCRDFCPNISPDGKYLFYKSEKTGNGDIYWVDIKTVENLRNTETK